MIAIETTIEFNYEKRNPSLLGRIRIEVQNVIRNHKLRQYEMEIVDSVIYKYNANIPVYENQIVQVPILDDNGNGTGEFTQQTITIQVGTTTEEREGIRVLKELKGVNSYKVSYEQAYMLEQAVLAYFPPDQSVTGGDLRDYITKYGLYLLTTQFEETPTYDVSANEWVIL